MAGASLAVVAVVAVVAVAVRSVGRGADGSVAALASLGGGGRVGWGAARSAPQALATTRSVSAPRRQLLPTRRATTTPP